LVRPLLHAGERGMSRMSRAAMMYGADCVKTANSNIHVFAMVETSQAMDNLAPPRLVHGSVARVQSSRPRHQLNMSRRQLHFDVPNWMIYRTYR